MMIDYEIHVSKGKDEDTIGKMGDIYALKKATWYKATFRPNKTFPNSFSQFNQNNISVQLIFWDKKDKQIPSESEVMATRGLTVKQDRVFVEFNILVLSRKFEKEKNNTVRRLGLALQIIGNNTHPCSGCGGNFSCGSTFPCGPFIVLSRITNKYKNTQIYQSSSQLRPQPPQYIQSPPISQPQPISQSEPPSLDEILSTVDPTMLSYDNIPYNQESFKTFVDMATKCSQRKRRKLNETPPPLTKNKGKNQDLLWEHLHRQMVLLTRIDDTLMVTAAETLNRLNNLNTTLTSPLNVKQLAVNFKAMNPETRQAWLASFSDRLTQDELISFGNILCKLSS